MTITLNNQAAQEALDLAETFAELADEEYSLAIEMDIAEAIMTYDNWEE